MHGPFAPEYTVARLVHLPRAHDGDVPLDRRLEEVALAVKLEDVLLDPGNDNGLLSAVCVLFGKALRDATGLDEGA